MSEKEGLYYEEGLSLPETPPPSTEAIIDLNDAQQQILLRRESLETARENRRIIQASYVAGKETLTRLNEAQRDYITADADLALARIRLRQAWSDLYAATSQFNQKLVKHLLVIPMRVQDNNLRRDFIKNFFEF